jgi:PAS domain-containing protein
MKESPNRHQPRKLNHPAPQDYWHPTVPARPLSESPEFHRSVLVRRMKHDAAEAQKDLKQCRERMKALSQATGQIIWIADGQGLIVEDAPEWRAFTGQTQDQVKGGGDPGGRPAAHGGRLAIRRGKTGAV